LNKNPENQALDAYILQLIKSEKLESVEQLVKLVQQKFHSSDKEILKRILYLQTAEEIALNEKPDMREKFSPYLISNKAGWYWATVLSAVVTVVLVFKIPENTYPLVYARYFFGSFFVLLLPGYALIRTLYPAKRLDNIERVGLSIGLSIALVCLDAFILNFTPWKITVLSITLTLSCLTVIFATIALLHERQLNARRRSTILYFFGPDGSGKSTLTKTIARELHKQGYKTKLSWMRGSHTLTSLAAKFFSHFGTFRGSANPYYNITIPRKLRGLWQFIEFLSALPIIISKFLFPQLTGYQVLADRYTLDLVVWICLTTRDYNFLKKFEAKVLITLAKKTDARFYVIADLEELERRTEKPWFSKEQLHLYYILAKAVDASIIDTTNKSAETSIQEVLETLNTLNVKN